MNKIMLLCLLFLLIGCASIAQKAKEINFNNALNGMWEWTGERSKAILEFRGNEFIQENISKEQTTKIYGIFYIKGDKLVFSQRMVYYNDVWFVSKEVFFVFIFCFNDETLVLMDQNRNQFYFKRCK